MRITSSNGQPQIPQQHGVHNVQQGETLSSIAVKLGLSESDLACVNNLLPGAELKLGQQLNVPSAIQELQVQHGIASMPDSFEIQKAPGTDLSAKGVIAIIQPPPEGDTVGIIVQSEGKLTSPPEGDTVGIWVQSEVANPSLNAAKLTEDIRFTSQFQPPQVAMGKQKSTASK